MGCCWDGGKFDKYIQRYWSQQPFTVLFVDGNHENFKVLNSYPTTIWNDGEIHQITDNIIHLKRGQSYTIYNRKIFTFGGARPHDKEYRKEGVSWWSEEMPSSEEYKLALENFEKEDYFDYLITHCADSETVFHINPKFKTDECTCFLQTLKNTGKIGRHFCGHYHIDVEDTDTNTSILYKDIIEIT